jgi:hypothetical protein
MPRNNPDNRVWIGLGVLGLGGGVWAYLRYQHRAKLRQMLEESGAVQAAVEHGLISWTPGDKSTASISFTDMKTADEAFAEILASLPKLPGSEREGLIAEIQGLGTQGKQIFEQATGVDVDAYVAPGTVGGRVVDTTRDLWSWVSGAPTVKANPEMAWDQYLADVGE